MNEQTMYFSALEALPLKSKLVANLITSRGWVNLCTQWIVLSFQGNDELHEMHAYHTNYICHLIKLEEIFISDLYNVWKFKGWTILKERKYYFVFHRYHYPWCKICFKVSSLTQITTTFNMHLASLYIQKVCW